MSNYRGAINSIPYRYRSPYVAAREITTSGGSSNIGDGASLAVSSRKIISAYSGNNYTIRRSNDNATTNIGFDSSDNTDSSAITSFVGSNSAFTTSWFNQTGSNDATQITTARQPRIVNAGTIQTLNGKVALNFSSASIHFLNFTEINSITDFTIFAVFTASADAMILGHSAQNRQIRVNSSGSRILSIYDGSTVRDSLTLGVALTTPTVCCWRRGSNILKFYQNNIEYSQVNNIASGTYLLNQIGTFLNGGFGASLNGNLAELIVFNSAISTVDIQSKMQDQMTYFGL